MPKIVRLVPVLANKDQVAVLAAEQRRIRRNSWTRSGVINRNGECCFGCTKAALSASCHFIFSFFGICVHMHAFNPSPVIFKPSTPACRCRLLKLRCAENGAFWFFVVVYCLSSGLLNGFLFIVFKLGLDWSDGLSYEHLISRIDRIRLFLAIFKGRVRSCWWRYELGWGSGVR